MGQRGRPRSLDEEKQREILALISQGCSLERAAAYVGCVERTLRREAERNPEFGQAIRRAALRAEVEPLHAVRNAARRDWRAAAWLLERSAPERFGRRGTVKLTPTAMQQLIHLLTQMIDDEVVDQKTRQRLLARLEATQLEQ